MSQVAPVSSRFRVSAPEPLARIARASLAIKHDHIDFTSLLARVAGRLAATEANRFDESIVDSLRQIAEALKLDAAIVWKKNPAEGQAVPTHYWVAADTPAPAALRLPSIPWLVSRLETGAAAGFAAIDELPDQVDRETLRAAGPASGMAFPLPKAEHESTVSSALTFASMTGERDWSPSTVQNLQLATAIVGQALARRDSQVALGATVNRLKDLRARRKADVEHRPSVRACDISPSIVSESSTIREALELVSHVAPTPATVLLLGETGVGKELFAQAIHDLSPRSRRDIVRVNCAAIPSTLIESELFGRERGAYTGAVTRLVGRFEAAHHSTLFLDEIGELPAEIQVKLLRAIQERVVERLGSSEPIKVDVRIVAATNRNLEQAVADKAFRQDLFYRLNVFPIVVPPLRERVEDIPGLVWAFIDEFCQAFGRTITSISRDSLRELERYDWPGNVRQLRNVIERAVIVSTQPHLTVRAPISRNAA